MHEHDSPGPWGFPSKTKVKTILVLTFSISCFKTTVSYFEFVDTIFVVCGKIVVSLLRKFVVPNLE